MPLKFTGLADTEAWAKKKLLDPGIAILERRWRIDALIYRNIAYEEPTEVTSVGVPEYEDAYREVYGQFSGMSVEKDEHGDPTTPDTKFVLFEATVIIPPMSFVPFSDDYHSTSESTFAFTKDDRITVQDYLVIRHRDENDDGERSKRIYLVDHKQGAGVTIKMYSRLVLTPQMGDPVGLEKALEEYDATGR